MVNVKPPARPGKPRALRWGSVPSAICKPGKPPFQTPEVNNSVWTAGIRTEEILRTPPPSLSSTEEELMVLSPPESRFSHTKVPSKPCSKEPDTHAHTHRVRFVYI